MRERLAERKPLLRPYLMRIMPPEGYLFYTAYKSNRRNVPLRIPFLSVRGGAPWDVRQAPARRLMRWESMFWSERGPVSFDR